MRERGLARTPGKSGNAREACWGLAVGYPHPDVQDSRLAGSGGIPRTDEWKRQGKTKNGADNLTQNDDRTMIRCAAQRGAPGAPNLFPTM